MISLFFKIYAFMYTFYLKIFKKNVEIKGRLHANGFFRIELDKNAKLKIASNLDIRSNVLIAVRNGGQLSIGKNCFFNRNLSIVCRDKISIGDNCMFGENIKIYDNDHKEENGTISRDNFITKPIKIEDNVWIANDVNILKGTLIRNNSIIGAMSLVNKDLKQSGVFTGIPVDYKRDLK